MEGRALKAVLTRLTVIGNAIIGRLDIAGQGLWTLEDLVECIPAASYKCIEHGWEPGNPHGFKKTRVWEVFNVNSRTGILFHSGNTDKDTLGCILVGLGVLNGKLINSEDAIMKMRLLIGNSGFDLQVIDRVAN